MRTKTLLVAGAIAVLGSVATYAQVYSQNTVGFYTINMVPGFNLIANQFNNGDNTVNTVIPATSPIPEGSTIQLWDPALQSFDLPHAFYAGFGWYDESDPENPVPSGKVLRPGEGAFVQVAVGSDPFSLVLVGEVPEGTLTRNLVEGFQMVSQLTPQVLGFNASGFPGFEGDVIQFWDPALQDYPFADFMSYVTDPGLPGGGAWVDSTGENIVDPTPALGEAVFYQRSAGAGGTAWTRTFNVSPD